MLQQHCLCPPSPAVTSDWPDVTGSQQGDSAATVSTEMGEKKAEASRGLKDRTDKQS